MRSRTTLLAALTAASLAAGTAGAAAAPRGPEVTGSLTAAASVGADATAYTGAGVGVAILDTGATPQPTLGDRIAARVDVSGSGRVTDGLGHGTFLTGLVVGQEGPTGHRLGISPDAHVLSVKVADAAGRTSLDRILAGIAAVKAAPPQLNIRVVVVAIGGPGDDHVDPIEEALEQLWADGYVVVVPSGNRGTLTEPGTSPYLLTVGALDDRGTADASDDRLPVWSGAGVGRDGRPKPDVLAPGVSVVSTRVPGSVADREHPSSRVGSRWFRGSGTSQAAAVAAGAAAVLLEADPSLTPDEVKGRLIDASRPVGGSEAAAIDVAAALHSTAVANTHLPAVPRTPPPADAPTAPGWSGMSWSAGQWSGMSWSGMSWSGVSWTGMSWSGFEWANGRWTATVWADETWAGMSWSGMSWSGMSWSGMSWSGTAWASDSWANASWTAQE